MSRCPKCSCEAPDGSRFCPSCGGVLEDATRTSADEEGDRSTDLSPAVASPHHRSLDESRFVPGTMLAGRYRIVGMLGRGGMGEVYRADDLKLGQPVALKFLPQGVERDANRLGRLLNEVKTARQVSHANVCRVFDIGEVDGHHFLSMEYVDGEDLSSLLRRIGRLPKDKATQIARQLCLGVHSAHEQGILHRDLKPANVMIDGRGQVKITDFGLAGLEDTIRDGETRSGTPAYMAPEQLAGREVTVRSDLYALGLVLYELFTGKQAFAAGSAAELLRQQQQSTPTNPSSHVEGFDPAVERAILRCLEREPRDRPASALAVAAALPGGDPLAAAMAAGETPSPEMVADAGSVGGLRPIVAWTCLVLVVAGLVGRLFLTDQVRLTQIVSLELPPEALSVEARRIVEQAGYEEPPVDTAYGFEVDEDYIDHAWEQAPEDRFKHVDTVRPAPIFFWYRQSPRYLTPVFLGDEGVGPADPPAVVAGMVGVRLDPRGRLLRFDAVPPQTDDTEITASEPEWGEWLDRAGIERTAVVPVRPRWNPLVDCDLRLAWEGTYPEQPEIPIRVEAGAWRGRVVFFEVVTPWTRPRRMEAASGSAAEMATTLILFTLLFAVLLGGLFLARRNLRLGRGDRRSAARIAFVVFAGFMIAWALSAHHTPTSGELRQFFETLVWCLFFGVAIWMLYIALEPYVRRLWPDLIISWNRLLQGRLRDPMVGRDILIGALFGVGANVLMFLGYLLPEWVGLGNRGPHLWGTLGVLAGVRQAIGELFNLVTTVGETLFFLFLLLLLRIVLRKQWVAAGALVLILATLTTLNFSNPLVTGPIALLYWGLLLFVLVRFGMLAFLSARVFLGVGAFYVLTADFSSWYAGRTLIPTLLLAALAFYGFHLSLAGRPVFGDKLLEAEAGGKP